MLHTILNLILASRRRLVVLLRLFASHERRADRVPLAGRAPHGKRTDIRWTDCPCGRALAERGIEPSVSLARGRARRLKLHLARRGTTFV